MKNIKKENPRIRKGLKAGRQRKGRDGHWEERELQKEIKKELQKERKKDLKKKNSRKKKERKIQRIKN